MVLFLLQSKLVLVRGFIPPQWTRVSLWCHPAFDVTLRAAKGLFRSAERSAGYPPGCFPGCHPERSECVRMTHIVTPGGSAHRSPPRAVFRPLVAAPRSDAWLRCTGPDQVTMWVIHTLALNEVNGVTVEGSISSSGLFFETALSALGAINRPLQ